MLTNLKALRTQRGVTQAQLAEAIGVSQQSVNKYENHNVEPDIETLIRIADFFGISVDSLFGRACVERRSALSASEELLLSRFRALPPRKRECLISVAECFSEK